MEGYWFCFDCAYKDLRPPEERYPDANIFRTSSVSAIVRVSPATLKRLYKKEDSLQFMYKEGSQLITHCNSATAWAMSWDEKKRTERQKQKENYQPFLIRNVSVVTDSDEES